MQNKGNHAAHYMIWSKKKLRIMREREEKLRRYERSFYETLRNTIDQFPWEKVRMPKMMLFDDYDYPKPVNGRACNGGKLIEIYAIKHRPTASIKRTIRHEMLHSVLLQAGRPGKDTDAIFLILASMFDANPYKLSERMSKYQDIGDLLSNIAKKKRFAGADRALAFMLALTSGEISTTDFIHGGE